MDKKLKSFAEILQSALASAIKTRNVTHPTMGKTVVITVTIDAATGHKNASMVTLQEFAELQKMFPEKLATP